MKPSISIYVKAALFYNALKCPPFKDQLPNISFHQCNVSIYGSETKSFFKANTPFTPNYNLYLAYPLYCI